MCLFSSALALIFLGGYVRVYALLSVCQSLLLEMCVREVNQDSTSQTLPWTQNYSTFSIWYWYIGRERLSVPFLKPWWLFDTRHFEPDHVQAAAQGSDVQGPVAALGALLCQGAGGGLIMSKWQLLVSAAFLFSLSQLCRSELLLLEEAVGSYSYCTAWCALYIEHRK